ncbi:MAG: hypothetical protein ACRD43_05050, partial [Pyrinomonadaceae bacterium]
FEVAAAGDTQNATPSVTYEAVARFVERDHSDFAGIPSEELHYALLLLASGLSIEHLRYRIDASLFALLESSADKLNAAGARAVLNERFGTETDENVEEEGSAAVFGSSLINLPRRRKRKLTPSEYEPLSSFSFR